MKKIVKKILGPLFSTSSPLYGSYHLFRGIMAATTYGFPSRKLIVIGVTGTNGKTTTANFIASILEAAGHKVGLTTTVNYWTGNNKVVNESKMTTDNPFRVQGLLRDMVTTGCKYAVIETSSHALAQHRTWGIDYDVAVFTNLTWDHLDYHKTFDNYKKAKLKLFLQTKHSRKKNLPKTGVVNLDDPAASDFLKVGLTNFGFTTKNNSSSNTDLIKGTVVGHEAHGIKFRIDHGDQTEDIALQFPGEHNVQNSLAAAGAALALGIQLDKIKRGLESVSIVPGRLEYIATQPFNVVVDYAHNPDGYLQTLKTLKEVTKGRLIVVFGSAGDRDKEKRPELGRIASENADILVLTEEDPGSEDPIKIIAKVQEGINPSFIQNQNLFVIPNRKDALHKALEIAKPGDTVAALAMGAQTMMATKAGLVPYNEREYIRNLLQSIVK